jgi:hypothetical protein
LFWLNNNRRFGVSNAASVRWKIIGANPRHLRLRMFSPGNPHPACGHLHPIPAGQVSPLICANS